MPPSPPPPFEEALPASPPAHGSYLTPFASGSPCGPGEARSHRHGERAHPPPPPCRVLFLLFPPQGSTSSHEEMSGAADRQSD